MVLFKQGINKSVFKWKITRSCINLVMESAKSSYPNEFGGFLRVDEDESDTIVEIVLIPGTISGDSHAIFKMHMLPVDFSIVGTVHSHPSPSLQPSSADLTLFRKHGKIHIIAANPYNQESWQAYDSRGDNINIKVI